MKVLYLCHRIPFPPDKGEKIRAFHQLVAMSARHEVDLFTLADDAGDFDRRSELRKYCANVTVARINPTFARLRAIPYLLTSRPLTLPCFNSAELRAGVRDAMARRGYDRIFVYCSAMAQYVDWPSKIPVVVDFVDVDSNKWSQYAERSRFPLSLVYAREGRRLEEYEARVAEQANCVLLTTEREARIARRIAPAARVCVVPNGVDADFFSPGPPLDADPPSRNIVFVGDMAYYPNQDAAIFFAKTVLPLVRRSAPDARFQIVGRNPSASVLALREIAGVEVTGFVPDVRPYLRGSAVAVAPFSMAAGIQNKILEAMACAVPVVATPRTVQGLSERLAACVAAHEEAPDIAAAVARYLLDPALARRVGDQSRAEVVAGYSWSAALDYLMELVENPGAAAAHPGSEPPVARELAANPGRR